MASVLKVITAMAMTTEDEKCDSAELERRRMAGTAGRKGQRVVS